MIWQNSSLSMHYVFFYFYFLNFSYSNSFTSTDCFSEIFSEILTFFTDKYISECQYLSVYTGGCVFSGLQNNSQMILCNCKMSYTYFWDFICFSNVKK